LHDGDEARLEEVYNQLHDIAEYNDPKTYKSYDELKAKLHQVLGEAMPKTVKQEIAIDDEIPAFEPKAAPAPQPATAESVMEDDDDTMSYFAKLAAED